MPSKWDLLQSLSVKKLRELAKENNVSLVEQGIFGDSRATKKDDIMNILVNQNKISKKKIQDKISGKASAKKKTTEKSKRRRILAADRSEILERQKGKCDSCGKKLDLIHKLYEIDHKQAISDGDKDLLDNFHALCLECYRKKTRKESSARAKVKRQSSLASKKPVRKKTTYTCKISTKDREWLCGKKGATKSCLTYRLFGNECEHLQVSRK